MPAQPRAWRTQAVRSLCFALAIGLPLCGRAAAQSGPLITFFGPASLQGVPLLCSGITDDGTPVCPRATGSGFLLIVEGRPGPAGNPVGSATFNATGLPDLQIQVDHPLGDGSLAVCDNQAPSRGGVAPASSPDPVFSDPDPVNDFACRFTAETCTVDQFGDPRFLMPTSTIQFCATIDPVLVFPPGDARISMRLRDANGLVGEVRELVLRVGAGTPVPTVTAAATPPPSPTSTRTPTAAPSVTSAPTASSTRTASRSATPTNSATPTATTAHSATPGASASPTPPVTRTPTATATPSLVPTAREPIDLDELIHAIFDASRQTGADVNDDHRVSAADLPARIALGP